MFLDATYLVEHKTVHCVHKTLVKRHDKKKKSLHVFLQLHCSWLKLAQLSFWLERNVLADLLYADHIFFTVCFSTVQKPLLC